MIAATDIGDGEIAHMDDPSFIDDGANSIATAMPSHDQAISKQRSPEWYAERAGKLTASMFAQAVGIGIGSRQQAWRRHFGIEVFEGNPATQWGVDHEPDALAAYQKMQDVVSKSDRVALTGFHVHPLYPWLGASPDFLIGDKGLGEIKCPANQTLYEEIPPYYMAQIQGQMEVTDRFWCEFVCWTPTAMRIWRVARSPTYWDWLHVKLAEFWIYVAAQIEPPRMKRPAIPNVDGLIRYDSGVIKFN